MKRKRVKKLAIIFNLKRPGVKDDSCEEYDEIETIDALRRELKAFAPVVCSIEQSRSLVSDIIRAKPDFVFNLAEGIGAGRARESQVPCILESLNIAYSGSDPTALGVTLDKYLTNIFLRSAGVPVPCAFMIKSSSEACLLKSIFRKDKLFIVKPRWEGSSRGVFLSSVVGNFRELKERVDIIFKKYKQPALVEEFLKNDEITVGVCGNDSPFMLGMMRIKPRFEARTPFLYSQENKREWEEKIKYEPQSMIKKNIKKAMESSAIKAFKALELRDIARIDFRLDSSGVPNIIDVNPLPGLSPYYSDLPIICKLNGKSYGYLVETILRESFKRNGFKAPLRRRYK
ncbi:MAG: ATP-grasp domain-containing protein [Candidatus Omnitrophica bacterium]|nr:ATP-grasp domain-containing protein [Candidatus Omnitrophota bacterium]